MNKSKSKSNNPTSGIPESYGPSLNATPSKGNDKKYRITVYNMALLLILLTLTTFGFLYHHISQIQQGVSKDIASLRAEQQQHKQDNHTTLRQYQNAVQKSVNQISSQTNSIDARIQNLEGNNLTHWKLIEIDFLLRLVNQYLLIHKNIIVGKNILKKAANLAETLDQNQFHSLHSALTADMEILDQVTPPNLETIYLKLTNLIQQIPNLQLLPPSLESSTLAITHDIKERHIPQPENTENFIKPDWLQTTKNIISSIWHNIFSTFRFSLSNKEPIKQLLTQEQENLLKLNLQLLLSQAQLAVLTQQPTIYTSSLSNAQTWIHKYFATDEQNNKTILAAIYSLLETKITTDIPVINQSLNILKKHLPKTNIDNFDTIITNEQPDSSSYSDTPILNNPIESKEKQ